MYDMKQQREDARMYLPSLTPIQINFPTHRVQYEEEAAILSFNEKGARGTPPGRRATDRVKPRAQFYSHACIQT